MCGINGIFNLSKESMIDDVLSMNKILKHRGPDNQDFWNSKDNAICLGHTRLSIIDTSLNGNQPMHSQDGKYVLVFNGEIYNFQDIRSSLIKNYGFSFKGNSDTECFLASIQLKGLRKTLEEVTGMFAFALWDISQKNLTLAIDRMGEKPLYYSVQNHKFAFSSELKGINIIKSFTSDINLNSVNEYFKLGYVNAPNTIYNKISKLVPGEILVVTENNSKSFSLNLQKYWNFLDVYDSQDINKKSIGFNDSLEELDNLVTNSIKKQMVADVPFGCFLSSGIDSSIVAAVMQKNSIEPVNTFTIGFNDPDYDEAQNAKQIASLLGTNHCESYLDRNDLVESIPILGNIYDEPFADSSQIPTYLVSKLASKSVKVVLTGDAGDELFGGYNRHFKLSTLNWVLKKIPLIFRSRFKYIISILPFGILDKIIVFFNSILPSKISVSQPKDKVRKLVSLLDSRDIREAYDRIVSYFYDPAHLLLSNELKLNNMFEKINLDKREEHSEWIMGCDTISYLPGNILTKVDRCSMSVSLESRVPFLDPEIVDFAWRIPLRHKINNGQGKFILRQLLDKYLPNGLIEKQKKGFGLPIDSLLKNELKDWSLSLLCKDAIEQTGFLNSDVIANLVDEYFKRSTERSHQIWNLLMFQNWFINQKC